MFDNLTEREKAELIFGIHENDMEPWTMSRALSLAQDENIQLQDEHIDVLLYLRAVYEKHGPIKHARTLTQALESKFATLGGLKYLYSLFPHGPVRQGCRIAGIPLPMDSEDDSFGSVF